MSTTGVKRDRDGNARAASQSQKQANDDVPRGRFHDMFEGFRNELDEHHDRKERITKVSRDVTALSKKMLVLLPFPWERKRRRRREEIANTVSS